MSELGMLETILLIVLVLGTGVALPKSRLRGLFLVGVLGAMGAWALSPSEPLAVQLKTYRPADLTETPSAKYVSSRTCRSCHPAQYQTWYGSYHRTMTQPASAQSIVAPFDGQILTEGNRSYRVFKHQDRYYVDMPTYGTAGTTQSQRIIQPVVMTTGSHHMQAYWIPVPWFGEILPPETRTAFKDLCSRCHGSDGFGAAAVSIVDADLDEEHIRSAMTTAEHAQIDRQSAEYEKALQYAIANQYTGRLAQFPFVYLTKAQRWAHEDHTFMQPPSENHNREPFGDRWSKGCDQCHSVRPSFAWKPGQGRNGEASVAELGIACEACHGPGRNHIERHQNPLNRYGRHLGFDVDDDIVNPETLDSKKGSHVCAQCHAELVVKEGAQSFEPGQSLESFAHVLEYLPDSPPQWLANEMHGEPDLLRNAFWRDGTIRIAGRDYNGMVRTPCFSEGSMSCLTCHTMHGQEANDQLKPIAKSNAVCAQCHPKEAGEGSKHTHHEPDSPGSACYNCHMPHTTVGLLGLIRAHRIDSPSASQSAWTGRPNACSLCHLDHTLEQTAEHLTQWYGQKPLPQTSNDLGASAVIAWLLRGDAVQRSAAAWHMAWPPALKASGSNWQSRYLIELLDDPYSAVRYIAGQALRQLPGFQDFSYDYTASHTSHMDARQDALKRWQKTRPSKTKKALLMHEGSVDTEKISVLKSKRDNSPVRVNE